MLNPNLVALASATGFYIKDGETFRTRDRAILDGMQKWFFYDLGYTGLARSLRIPIVNLHSGEMADVPVPNGFVFNSICLQRSLTEIDLLCSVPMMKTHFFAQVTLGMKNLMGLYLSTVYFSIRGQVETQDFASLQEYKLIQIHFKKGRSWNYIGKNTGSNLHVFLIGIIVQTVIILSPFVPKTENIILAKSFVETQNAKTQDFVPLQNKCNYQR